MAAPAGAAGAGPLDQGDGRIFRGPVRLPIHSSRNVPGADGAFGGGAWGAGAPKPPATYFDAASAARGKSVFLTKAQCASCHALPLYADNVLHSAAEIGIDDFEALRSPTGKYRTTTLGGLFAKEKGGFYHDGRFPTLTDVVNHYNNHLTLGLTAKEKQDLVEYLKSL